MLMQFAAPSVGVKGVGVRLMESRVRPLKHHGTKGSKYAVAVRLFSYVVRWDHGFAPNPFFASCTVATCKPAIRNVAAEGHYILGTGTAERGLNGRIVFIMRVDEVTTFDNYWNDPRFSP